jgi:ADP-ribosylglycohydrolase
MKTILILEDNDERISDFVKAVQQLGDDYELKFWRDAHSMCRECATFFPTTALISLNDDVNPATGNTRHSSKGAHVAKFLADFLPVCPVLLHSSNTNLLYSTYNEFRFSGWTVERLGSLGVDWIPKSWLPKARQILLQHGNTWKADLPFDNALRVERMMVSLDGLSIGDALGEMFFFNPRLAPDRLKTGELPDGPWFHTDDTEMAISIAGVVKSHGKVEQDALAKRFYRRWERDPDRGYGGMTRIQMREMATGENWRATSTRAFGGQGSKGNGGAMRVAPLGAYFADDLNRVANEAEASSVVTHVHPEGVAGTVATDLAAAMAWQLRAAEPAERAQKLFGAILQLTPESEVRRKIQLASQISEDTDPLQAAKALGRGELVTAPDTVPFCLWLAAYHMDNYPEAIGLTISVGGDCDTNAAIVGGIIANSVGREGIPQEWLGFKEPFIV